MALTPKFTYSPGNQWTLPAGVSIAAGLGAIQGNAFKYVGTGAASGFLFPVSTVIPVTPGQTYTLSMNVDASHVTSGSPFIAIYDPGITTQYGGKVQTAGTNSRIQQSFTVPAGVYKVVFIFDTANCTVANAQNLLASNPQLEPGSAYTTYTNNSAYNMVPDPDLTGIMTLIPTYPPTGKPFAPELEATRHDSITSTGLVQSISERVDQFLTLNFTTVPQADLQGWSPFMQWAQGGIAPNAVAGNNFAFAYFPDATDPLNSTNYTMEPAPFIPKRSAMGVCSFSFRMRQQKT